MSSGELWMLADAFEDRSKDVRHYGPLQRMIWKRAHEEMVKALGPRLVGERQEKEIQH